MKLASKTFSVDSNKCKKVTDFKIARNKALSTKTNFSNMLYQLSSLANQGNRICCKANTTLNLSKSLAMEKMFLVLNVYEIILNV